MGQGGISSTGIFQVQRSPLIFPFLRGLVAKLHLLSSGWRSPPGDNSLGNGEMETFVWIGNAKGVSSLSVFLPLPGNGAAG